MQNLRSSILSALASSLTPPFSRPQTLLDLGLLPALPLAALPGSLLAGVGCRRADRLALFPLVRGASAECELRGGLTLNARLGGVLIAARDVLEDPLVTVPRAGRGPWLPRDDEFRRGSTMALVALAAVACSCSRGEPCRGGRGVWV